MKLIRQECPECEVALTEQLMSNEPGKPTEILLGCPKCDYRVVLHYDHPELDPNALRAEAVAEELTRNWMGHA